MMSMEEYLAQFPDEVVSYSFARGGHTMMGREGSYYCANCDKYIGDCHSNDISWLPKQNESSGHCYSCKNENVEGYA